LELVARKLRISEPRTAPLDSANQAHGIALGSRQCLACNEQALQKFAGLLQYMVFHRAKIC